jgi:glycosyltransferase involved in cell wall biosynthesis
MQPGRVTIMHHHLHPGGVTRIIESQVQSLRNNYPELKIRVLCGHSNNPERFDHYDVEVLVHEEVDYLYHENPTHQDVNQAVNRLYAYLKNILEPGEIVHVHNLNLGKNPLVTYTLYQLARDGQPILNHAHDFAEDRPQNMAFLRFILQNRLNADPHEIMYPAHFDHYHFSVINTFDRERLLNMGFPPQRVSYLPNPVTEPDNKALPERDECRKKIVETLQLSSSQKIVTYPVRVIRRKNIGELILLSELFRGSATFLVTLAPKNPVELEHYQQWRAFCRENQLDNIHFEVGELIAFPELVKGSDFCITTSIREGFGMAYMEPWLYRTPVVGRDIEYITQDFLQTGISFPGLYQQIWMPHAKKDFKDLEIQEQMYEILRVTREKDARENILLANQALSQIFREVEPQTIDDNIQRIIQHYSLDQYGKKIMAVYQKLSGPSGTPAASADKD